MQTTHTNKNSLPILIDWTLGAIIDTHDHEIHYEVSGEGTDQIEYNGTAIFIDGEFSEVVGIDEV